MLNWVIRFVSFGTSGLSVYEVSIWTGATDAPFFGGLILWDGNPSPETT